jgi:hypothetical protein
MDRQETLNLGEERTREEKRAAEIERQRQAGLRPATRLEVAGRDLHEPVRQRPALIALLLRLVRRGA